MAVTLEPESEFLSLCVNSSLKITCTSSTTLLQWELITNEQFNNSLLGTKVYTNTSSMEDVKMNDSFTTRLESKSPLVSTVTLNALNPETQWNGFDVHEIAVDEFKTGWICQNYYICER